MPERGEPLFWNIIVLLGTVKLNLEYSNKPRQCRNTEQWVDAFHVKVRQIEVGGFFTVRILILLLMIRLLQVEQ